MAKLISLGRVPAHHKGIVPKLDVKEGDSVLVGTPLFHDKQFYDIKVVSPVAGTVKAVVRGERRKLERIVIEPDPSLFFTPDYGP